jgi:hypothetical protein
VANFKLNGKEDLIMKNIITINYGAELVKQNGLNLIVYYNEMRSWTNKFLENYIIPFSYLDASSVYTMDPKIVNLNIKYLNPCWKINKIPLNLIFDYNDLENINTKINSDLYFSRIRNYCLEEKLKIHIVSY